MITLSQIDDLMNWAISFAMFAVQDFNQALQSYSPALRLNLFYISAAALAKSPICCCMRAQSDAAGMTEQVQTYRSMLFPVYGKCGGKKEEEGEEKRVGSQCPDQNKADQINRHWGCRTCWKQHPVYLDGITKVSLWSLDLCSYQLTQSCSHTWTES